VFRSLPDKAGYGIGTSAILHVIDGTFKMQPRHIRDFATGLFQYLLSFLSDGPSPRSDVAHPPSCCKKTQVSRKQPIGNTNLLKDPQGLESFVGIVVSRSTRTMVAARLFLCF
jgi:hypothetical protein